MLTPEMIGMTRSQLQQEAFVKSNFTVPKLMRSGCRRHLDQAIQDGALHPENVTSQVAAELQSAACNSAGITTHAHTNTYMVIPS